MTLTNPMKVVLALVLIALIGLGFWVMDWQKKFNELSSLQTNLQTKKDKYEKAKQAGQDLPKEMARKDELERTLRSLIQEQISPEPASVFVPAYIQEVENLVLYEQKRMRDDNFTVLSLTPGIQTMTKLGGTEEKKPAEGEAAAPAKDAAAAAAAAESEALKGYPTRTFQMSLQGRYTTLIDFLHQLGALKLKRLVTINRIALAPSRESVAGSSPVLSIQMPITAYLWQGGE
ncbi:MAG: hypothetical protein M1269_03960 [Chloroflexi bacterium]|nr:hypothetical protein [Chloroflexota bacterium]